MLSCRASERPVAPNLDCLTTRDELPKVRIDWETIPKGKHAPLASRSKRIKSRTKDRYLSVHEALKWPQTMQIDTAEVDSRCSHASHNNLRVALGNGGTRPIVPDSGIWLRIIAQSCRGDNYYLAFARA